MTQYEVVISLPDEFSNAPAELLEDMLERADNAIWATTDTLDYYSEGPVWHITTVDNPVHSRVSQKLRDNYRDGLAHDVMRVVPEAFHVDVWEVEL